MIKEYRFNGNLEKWIYQNQAETIDGFDGCLIDNYLFATKNGIAAFYERYATEWTSYYEMHFSRDREGMNTIEEVFYNNREEVEKEAI